MEFPGGVTHDPSLFDAVIERMLYLSDRGSPFEALTGWLKREHALDEHDMATLGRTYQDLSALQRTGRDHIWGFVARNLVRPVWLSQPEERADVIVGNPPWLAFNRMSSATQGSFREECKRVGVWVGGRGITPHQDLAAYFFARCVELYLKPSGTIAFVMPFATMSRRQFEAFRSGQFATRKRRRVEHFVAAVRFTQAWAFPDDVQPLFPVPSCVLFAHQRSADERANVLPDRILIASGTLARRDATTAEASGTLSWRTAPWPEAVGVGDGSWYRDLFRQGAIIIPRILWTVEPALVGMLGGNRSAPVVESRRTSQEKRPWKDLPPLHGNVKAKFLRPLYLGESVAPFRLLKSVLAVIPWDERSGRILDSEQAHKNGYLHLGGWLAGAEQLWEQHGRGNRTLTDQIDFYKQLSAQFPLAPLRVVYSKAGTLPAVAVVTDRNAVVDHKLYWYAVNSEIEPRYLLSVLNSETARARAAHLQSRGQWGARDFDKVMFSLSIPRFDASVQLHRELADTAAHAEEVAAAVDLKEGTHFVTARRRIREALRDDGVADRIDGEVSSKSV